MKNVWVIEQGSYSDYGVVGVFSSEKNAQRVCDLINASENCWDKATIAKWPLDPCIEELNQGLSLWQINMPYDGNVTSCVRRTDIDGYNIKTDLWVHERTKAPAWEGRPIQDQICGIVWAKDEQHAIKIANEFRAQAIAENRMGERAC